MEQGRIVQQGTHDALMEMGGLYRRLYEVQFRDIPEANGSRDAAPADATLPIVPSAAPVPGAGA
jgi:hypothetical protein